MGTIENIATAVGSSSRHRVDDEVKAAVEEALHANPDIDAFDVEIAVGARCVRLSGKVGSYAERTAAEQIAAEVAGVNSVENDIHVRPYGANWALTDDQIAQSIGRALSELPTVDVSAVEFDVSCHVVTLTGAVRSDAVRALVRHRIETLPGVDFVRNRIGVRHGRWQS